MINTFRLSFVTTTGQVLEISVPRANINVTDANVRTAMNQIINSAVIVGPKGRPFQRHAARLLKTQTTEFGI